jgi:hypothetical protein
MQLDEGVLNITVVKGKLTKDKIFGTLDPYCTITFLSKKFKTKVHKNGGKSP